MTKTIIRKRRMKESLSSFNQSMTNLCSLLQRQSNSFKVGLLCLFLIALLPMSRAASVTGGSSSSSRTNTGNLRYNNDEESPHPNSRSNIHRYRLLDHQNEYDSSSSVLDDDTLRLSLAIDDDSTGGLSAPSLHTLEPRVYLRISGESGMIRPDYQLEDRRDRDSNNEVISRDDSDRNNFNSFRASSPTSNNKRGEARRTDLPFQSDNDENESVEVEDSASEDEDMSDNYHHHFPYIESYREKYIRPESRHFIVTTTPPPPPSQTVSARPSFLKKEASSQRQEWSDIIAQVTTPSSFNEINSSASEHRLADFHFRANLPSYFYNKYSSYSDEDLENVADLDDEHSKYFVKTRPRSVTTAGSNIYSNFYYEPPSFSTKSVPIPVKTNKDKVFFVSAKPTQDHRLLHHPHLPLFEEGDGSPLQHYQSVDDDDDEMAQQDSPVMTTISSNFSSNLPTMRPPFQMNYDREGVDVYRHHQQQYHHHLPNPNEGILKTSASSVASIPTPTNNNDKDYYQNYQNLNNASNNNNSNKSSAETLDVSTSQSILSKVTVNNPHHQHHLQIVHIRPDFQAKHNVAVATPEHRSDDDHDDNIHHHNDGDGIRVTSEVKIASSGDSVVADTSSSTTTEHPLSAMTDGEVESTSTPASTVTTTTDATSIPGVPGIDYPTLGEIPQTGFDCGKQRYKGFFADIDAKCQAWHYCDFTDGHSTFLCPNGTLFSQVLLTCDWWFNVDCNQARQLYVLNERLYRYIKPPKPSFPEDFIGEHVDKWLLQQFNNGYLPKVRRKKAKPKYATLPPPPLSSMDDSPTEEKREN